MENKSMKQSEVPKIKKDEKILVVATKTLFSREAQQGFFPTRDFGTYQNLIMEHRQFLWRSVMEADPSFKQIIPNLVFQYNDTYFLMRRRSDATEVRLQNKCSLGIGGHIREEDMADQSLVSWARREFHEEVSYYGAVSVMPLGIINDDSNAVGQVHLGFVFLLKGDCPSITIKSELKEGNLLTLEQMRPYYDLMENWSQMVFDFLVQEQSVCRVQQPLSNTTVSR